jgi:hypothetical protein
MFFVDETQTSQEKPPIMMTLRQTDVACKHDIKYHWPATQE